MSWNVIWVECHSTAVNSRRGPSGLDPLALSLSPSQTRTAGCGASEPPTVPVHRLQSDMNIACSNTCGKGYIKSYIFNATFSMPIKRLYAKDQIMSFCTVWEQDTRERCGKWQWSHPGAAAFGNWHLEGICRACCKHIVLQAPQLLGPIGFLHLWRFPIG